MDSLTHIVLGAAIGEALLGKKIGRKAMLWGALADTIPDFDVFASPCVSQAQQLFFLGMFTHILIDALTSYGTGWFEPFSSYRVSFNTIFVADLFYTIPFLICVIIALIAKSESERRKR